MPIPQTDSGNTSATGGKFYLVPFILVTSLFFLWGLANILNSALISHFQPVFEISRAQALFVETAFYFGYFTIAIPAGFFIEKYNYKKGIFMGLVLYAIGALLFIPAAKTLTFGFFLFALYIIASGLAFLETAANPYVTILGKAESSVARINFAQMFNGAALVVGPWLAGQFIFAGNEGAMSSVAEKQQAADAVIFPYMLIGGFVLVVALLFLLVKMPEPSKGSKLLFDRSIFKKKHLMMATLTQFFYVGAQASIWGITIDYVIHLLPDISKEVASKNYLLVGTSLFVTGRIIGTFLLTVFKGNRLLAVYGVVATALVAGAMFASGDIAVYSLLATNFFMSIMFPTIFALGVKDLGEQTKLGSSLIIMSIVGGAVIPPLMGQLSKSIGIQLALVFPLIAFLVVAWFGLRGYRMDESTQEA